MRHFPRVSMDLPAVLERLIPQAHARLADISLGGAFLNGDFSAVGLGDAVFFKYHLPQHGPLEHSARAIRKETRGMAVAFEGLDRPSKMKLWKFLAEKLRDSDLCPYCGQEAVRPYLKCGICGWNLDFGSPSYLEYHEKARLLKELIDRAGNQSADRLRRALHFLEEGDSGQAEGTEFPEFVGESQAMKEVLSRVRKVASTDMPVLICGESGTGKEFTAQAIHRRSPRKEMGFFPINCAAIPENLLEAELFGYEKGAHTGVRMRKIGKFEQADGGTLFLDEIGEFSAALQVRLLRFLENQVVERMGGAEGKRVDVRFIAATNRDLDLAMARKQFRPDLYYRLEAFTLTLPPVRERGEDKLLLARHFLDKFSRETGLRWEFSKETLKSIEDYPWPGNVRELMNKVRKAMVLGTGGTLMPADLDLPAAPSPREGGSGRKNGRGRFEPDRVRETLEECGQNISRAARVLGVSRPTLYSLKKKYAL